VGVPYFPHPAGPGCSPRAGHSGRIHKIRLGGGTQGPPLSRVMLKDAWFQHLLRSLPQLSAGSCAPLLLVMTPGWKKSMFSADPQTGEILVFQDVTSPNQPLSPTELLALSRWASE
jgi:hypothetical protein